MAYPSPITFADLKVGMPIQADIAWTYWQITESLTGVVTSVSENLVTLNTGRTAPNPAFLADGQTVTYQRTGDGVIQPDEPPLGSILLDDTGDAWQATGALSAIVWCGINGERLTWSDFLAAHPTFTLLADTPPSALPDPVSPYPQAIDPDTIVYGMDIRATVTYDNGSTDVFRGIVAGWTNDYNSTVDPPAFIILNRFIYGGTTQFDPFAPGQTVVFEQMQEITPATDWGQFPEPEPPIGTVIKSGNGVAWQRITDYPSDAPADEYRVPGRGQWLPVTQTFIEYSGTASGTLGVPAQLSQPVSWPYVWFDAAPFTIQQVPPPPPTQYTSTWVATDSRTWNDTGTEADSGDSMYQGNDATAGQVYHSAFVCNGVAEDGETDKTMAQALAGATNVDVFVGVYATFWKSGSGQANYQPFTGSTLATTDTTGPSDNPVNQDFTDVGWMWTKVPAEWVSATNTGARLGPPAWLGPSTFGWFSGATEPDETWRPRIRVTYTRPA